MRPRAFVLAAILCAIAPAVHAESPAAPTAHDGGASPAPTRTPHLAHVTPKAAEPKPPAAPAPSITLTIEAPGPEVAWTMHVENTGAVPLRIAADARLLALDVTPSGAKRKARCELPYEMRPHDDDDRALVLPPGRSYSELFDPRLFCFGTRDGAALVAGASVVAHLGWTTRGRAVPPYAVAPIAGLEPAVAAAREIVSTAFEIGAGAFAPPKEASATSPLSVHSPDYVDVAKAKEAAIPVTLKNESTSAVTFFLRPETLVFEVTGPSGVGETAPSPTVKCAVYSAPNTSIRDVFTTLAPKGRAALVVMLDVLCPEHAFDQSGLYFVRAKLDTRQASGRAIGLKTFDGEAPNDGVTRLRVRETADAPVPRPRPKLDEAKRSP